MFELLDAELRRKTQQPYKTLARRLVWK